MQLREMSEVLMKYIFCLVSIITFACIIDASEDGEKKEPRKHKSLPEHELQKAKFPITLTSTSPRGHSQERSKLSIDKKPKSSGRKNKKNLKKEPSENNLDSSRSSGKSESEGNIRIIAYSEEQEEIVLPDEPSSFIKKQKLICKSSGNYYGAKSFQFYTTFSVPNEYVLKMVDALADMSKVKRIKFPKASFLTGSGETLLQ